ncbi:MAG: hypothetical protein WC465_04000 [Patescibacteria group bacterium]
MFYLMVFGAALTARLMHRRWQAWATWVVMSVVAIIAKIDKANPDNVLAITVACSVAGFIGPELWHSLQALLRHQRTALWLLLGGAVWLAITNRTVGHALTSLISGIAILAIVFFALRAMLRGVLGGGGRRGRR